MTHTGRRRFPVLLAAIAALLVFIAVDAASSPVQAQTPSEDASLSSLSLGDDIELSATFSATTTSYTASATSSVASTTVTAATTDEDATVVIMINGVEDADGTVDLVAGYNDITVEVTAQDGTTTRTYTVTVLRAAPDDDSMSTDDTITSLLSLLDVKAVDGASNQIAGYIASNSQGSLSPAGFNYPAGFGRWYTVEKLAVEQGKAANSAPTSVAISVRGTVTSGTDRAHVLPSGASITLHLEGEDFSKSYSLNSATTSTVALCVDVEDGSERTCKVGETATETYKWTTNLPPRLADDHSVLVRLRYSAPRPGMPGRPLVTAPTGKSGALVVNWTAPANDDPEVRGYEVHVSPAPDETGATGVARTTGGSTTRLPVLLLEPDTAYDIRVRARTYFASGPWSETVRAATNLLQGTNNPSVTLDLDDVTKVKVGDRLYKRLKVTEMDNLHADAFPAWFEGYNQSDFVEFRVLGGIQDSYEYEDLTHGEGEGAFYAGALTIGEDGEVYHDFGYEVIAEGRAEGEKGTGAPEYGPLYLWLERTTGVVQIGSTANSRETALCVEIADDSNTVPTGRECPSMDGSAGHAVQRITARFNDVPPSHDGESEFNFQVAFVKDVGISPTSLREDALAATGGAVTRVQRVDDRSDLFEITVEPDSDEDVTITLSSSGDCGEAGSICSQEEDPRKLYNSPTATVAGPILTASFQGLPSQHDGETAFSFRIAFSDEIATDEEEFWDHSVEVWGGEVTRAEPVGQRRDLWEVEVEPASDDSVMVSLRPTQSCAATGAVCTAGGRLLSVIPATMVPGPATWPVRVTGEAQVGKTLTADSSNLSERYGVQVTSMTYRWLADGARVPGANSRTYRPDDDKQGKRISVMATYTDDRGNEDTVTSGPTEPLAARDRIRRATGLPLISGRALVGHTLTADKSLIIDANGLENAVFYYFWEADDDSIPGATGTTYTPVAADVGKVITVIVAWVDDAGHGQNMTSPATLPVMTEEAAAAAAFADSLRYVANADGSVTLHWNAPDDEVTGYRILRSRHTLGEREMLVYVADTGSTATTFTDTGVVAGVPHSYRVQAIRDGELGERTKSFKTKVFPLRKPTNSPATGAPTIGGTAQVGETLTATSTEIADADGLLNITKNYLWAAIDSSGKIGSMYAYQWLADDEEIEDAAGYNYTTYTLTEDDVGKAMSVRVTFVDDAGYQETLTSAATDPVAALPQPNSPARGAPTIGGTAQVGETLTADTSGITDEDGLDDSTFTHQWVREDSVMVASAAGSYTPTDGDRGKSVKVRVSFTDDDGNPETRTSAQTATVEARANSAGICDRTEQAQREILSHIPGVDDCAKVSDSHLSGITMMTIANSREPFALRAGDFDGLANLDWLVMLYADSPRTLPDGIFDGLANLDNLDLIFFAGPDTLPDGIFDELENLTILHLRIDEDLDSLPGDVFDALTKLKRLSVKFEAGPTELPEGVFDELTNLEWLIVRNKTPANLPEGAFDELAKLEKLEWTYGLTSLPGGAFDALTNLEELDLSRNYLTSLPDGVFDALTNLEELDLSRNYLTSLPDGVFDALTNLEELDLSRNAISSMPDELFDDLPESTDLTVDRQNRKSPPDYPTRGRPVINGVAQVGQTLTVSTSGMSDQNGMTEATFEYRWYTHPNRRELQGTSGYDEGDTYTVGPDDAGKRILVKVIYTDDAGNRESIKSARTAPVSPPPVEVIPPTSPQFLESSYLSPDRDEVEVVWSSPIYNGGSPITRYRIEWIEADGSWDAAAFAQGGVSAPLMDFGWQFEIVDLQPCMSYRMRVIASNIAGDGKASAETMPEAPYPLESTMPNLDEAVVNYAALTLTYDEVLNQNLMPPASAFTVTVEGTRRTVDTVAVEGQSVTLTLADVVASADAVTVGYTNPAGTADGCIVGTAAGLAPSFSDWPATNNTGATDRPHGLRAAADSDVVTLTWQAPDADTDPSDYRILRHRPEAGETEPVVYVSSTGNTATSFADTAVEPEALYVYRVQASDLNAQWGEVSEPVSIRVPRSNSPATGPPVITGMAQVGQTLTMYIHDIADADGMENTRFRIKWLADGMVIQGVYDHVLLLVAADEGKRIEVRVSFTDDAGNEENLTSTATDAVAARPNTPATGLPTISGMAQVDETMKADITGIADTDGLTNAVFAHQWLADDADIQGATNSTYTLADSDEGRAIKVRVSFTDDAGNEESLTSAPTAAVAAPLLPPDSVRAVTQNSGAVELTWDAPQDGTVTGYRIERRRAGGGRSGQQRSDGNPRAHHTLVEDTGSTDTGYTDKSAEKGVRYEYRVSARNEAGAGEGSDWVKAGPEEEPVLGDGPPGAPRNLTATAGNKEITLSWEPPDDNGNTPATRYRIEWRVDGKDYDKNHWGTSRSTNYTTNDQANLANGVKYFFRVKAENGSGNSYGPYGPASEDVSATPTSGSAVDLGTPVLSDTENLHHGMVRLDWEDIEDAGWYVVQYYHVEDGEWLDLPAEGVDIAFHGSSAVVSNLHGLSWLQVRAMSCAGESEWSQIEQLFGTNASDWEGVPVPEVEEGDQIEPCPVVLGTPVLSDTEALHHGMVQLDWQDIEDAGWYVVQYYHLEGGEWLDLPAEGVDIAFHGSSAVVSNLHGLSWLRVRAMSCAGESEWSQIEQLFGTNASDWEGVPVPEVEEGDEIEPCPEDADTSDNNPATGAPTISGTAQVGEVLEVDTSGIADADGLSNVQYEYQWLADDADISGATNATYTLVTEDEGKSVKVRVSFTDDAYNEETLTSAATAAVAAKPNSPATGAPTISGTAQVGETLTANTSGVADVDGLSNVQYEYQWLADDAEISGATNATYTLTDSEESKTVKVQVSFTDDADNEETLTSAATGAVAGAQPTEPPAKPRGLDATATHDSVTLTWDDPGDNTITGYVILRRIPGVDPEGHFDVLVANTGTAATTYTDDTVSADTRYTYRIKAINGAGTSERSRWSHIDTPAAPVPDRPTGLSATSSHDFVTLTWDDPGDDSITGYVILRRVRVNDQGGDFSVLVADTDTAALTYTDATVAAGTTYTYRIKAINEHGTSERSSWYHIDIPEAP